MPSVSKRSEAQTAIQTHLAASFVSLELSRSSWLITSLSPGSGEKMSKHSVRAGDVAALLARFSELKRKASERTGKSFPIVVIQEAGLDKTARWSAPYSRLPRMLAVCPSKLRLRPVRDRESPAHLPNHTPLAPRLNC
jgi:hypothetical protein